MNRAIRKKNRTIVGFSLCEWWYRWWCCEPEHLGSQVCVYVFWQHQHQWCLLSTLWVCERERECASDIHFMWWRKIVCISPLTAALAIGSINNHLGWWKKKQKIIEKMNNNNHISYRNSGSSTVTISISVYEITISWHISHSCSFATIWVCARAYTSTCVYVRIHFQSFHK